MEEPTVIIQEAKQNQTVSITLEEHCSNYLELKNEVRTITNQITQIKQESPEWKEYDELSTRLSELKVKLKDSEKIDELVRKRMETRSEIDATSQVICALIKEKQQTLFEVGDSQFKIKEKLEVKKKE